MNAGRVSPSLALAAYAETWISGAKVIVFGDALSPLPERLVERGARHVQVYDRDATRAAEATAAHRSKQIAYAALEDAGSTLRDGVYDVGIIEDLAAAQGDPNLLLKPLGRALSRRGMALIAARNPEIGRRLLACSLEAEQPIGYYDLYDTVSQHFDEVRMLGQTAFVGYAVADFSATEAAEVRIDTAFLPNGAEEPEWFLALVSALPVTADSFSVIQFPFADVQLPSAVAERAPREAEPALRAQTQSAAAAAAKIVELQAELASREEWLTGLESRASTADQRADEMQSELDQLLADAARAKQELAKRDQRLEEELRAKKALEDGARALKQELDKLRKNADGDADGTRALKLELDKLRKAADIDADGTRALKLELDKLRKAANGDADGTRALKLELDKLKKSAEAEARKGSKLEAEARLLTQRVEQLTAELRASELRLSQRAEAPDAESQSDLRELETRLTESAGEVSRLTEALHKTERFGRQLIAELNQLKAKTDADSVTRDVARLSQRNAELEANLEAARWTISSLQPNQGDEPAATAGAKRRDESGSADPLRAPGAD
jgi:hypothetical protein